ncbi:Wzz/FepE/Etk N-terminal domain-containing protein [Pseudidiomarina taiwanensis]|uniref:LPS O-antigen length regulator n=1 Tax=Pseudidiomarina taiwanensis TaxID=337250 RepID=A0A432ZKB2_9GAMM|nr:Wzz/FepE/Etk N-terminal domain-containing protein [Pseudidiomarina taiwanensis]RUO78416.1 LPS O-antigen length regulator [Pseudidiomarina taiwanensis]
MNNKGLAHMNQDLTPFQPQDDEIDLRELFATLWRGKWTIIAITFVFAVGSVIYSLSLPNIYKAEALLAPTEESSGGGLSAIAGQFGGLAGLAGINLGGGEANKTTIALELLQSRVFLTEFVEKHQLLPQIMAVKSWSPETGIVFDEEIYDVKTDTWVREVSPPQQQKQKPSSWVYVGRIKEMLTASQEKDTGLVTLSVEHQSPDFAQQLVELLVEEINITMRERDVVDAQNSLSYLNNELKNTNLSNMQQVFYQLIEKQTQTLMLTNVRPEYIFETIDPAVVPEEKSSPKRSLICILGTMLGGMLGIGLVLVRQAFKSEASDKANQRPGQYPT